MDMQVPGYLIDIQLRRMIFGDRLKKIIEILKRNTIQLVITLAVQKTANRLLDKMPKRNNGIYI